MGIKIKTDKNKLIMGLIIVIIILLTFTVTFLITKGVYYDRGVEEQSMFVFNSMILPALDCQLINIQLDPENTLQLVNTACLQS